MSHGSDDCVYFFKPLNEAQQDAWDLAQTNDLVFLNGVAGSGKTTVALALAIYFWRKHKRKILVIRPCVETGPSLGYLPGELDDKVAPYREVIDALCGKLVHKLPPDALTFRAPGYLRGCTFDNSTVILDEAQNAPLSQLKMILTRLGNGSKLLVCGDPEQCDIRPSQHGYACDLDYVMAQLEDLPSVAIVDFLVEDCVRHPLVKRILKRL